MKRQWNAEEMKEAARDAYCSAHGDPVPLIGLTLRAPYGQPPLAALRGGVDRAAARESAGLP